MQARKHLQDLNIGDMMRSNEFDDAADANRGERGSLYKFKEHMIGQYSMISPMPGSTPPAAMEQNNEYQTNREFKMIENFLRQNNIHASTNQASRSDMQIPLPVSKTPTSRVGQSMIGNSISDNNTSEGAAAKQSTLVRNSKGQTFDTQVVLTLQS
jgi:hypothetical protein